MRLNSRSRNACAGRISSPASAPRLRQCGSWAVKRTTRSESTSGGSNGASVTLNGPVMFVGAVAASNVQRTSSAVTGRPSLHRARGSIVKVKASPSSDTVHSDASPGA